MNSFLFSIFILFSAVIHCQVNSSSINQSDTTKPVAPMITHFSTTDSTIIVNWEYFQVNKLDSNFLIRSTEVDKKIIFKWKSDISTDRFIDKVDSNGTYEYQIVTKNSVEKISKSLKSSVDFQNYPPPAINNVKVNVNTSESYVELSWEKPLIEVISYDIYRGLTKDNMNLIEVISPESEGVFVDRDLQNNNKYIYSIQYISADGLYSPPSYIYVDF